MMNDPTVLEASRFFAQRLLTDKGATEENIQTAFHSILCRAPSEKEIQILKDYYKEQLDLFKNRKLDAAKTLAVGDSPVNKKLDPAESAALMKVVNTIYNLEEAITKS
jgi:hypothetical protein